MRGLVIIAAALLAGAAVPKSPIDGVWVADLSSQRLPPMLDDYLVANGTYTCRSCTPPRSYPADGKPHPIPGDPDVTSESVTVTGPRTIVTRIVSPAMTRETTMTVAGDNRTATYVSIDHRPGVPGPLRSEYIARRVGEGPPGSHPVSGKWRGIRYVEVPVQVRTTELHEQGDQLTYRSPVGASFTATYGGPFVTVQGPYHGRVTAAVRRVSAWRVVELRKEDGKPIMERTYEVSPDGRSMKIAVHDLASGKTYEVTAHRK